MDELFDKVPDTVSNERSISSSLLERIRLRDAEGWQRLFQLFGPIVYSWCRQSGMQASDAADAVQEVFRSVAGNVDGFQRQKPGDTFRGWLWTITKNRIRYHFRQASGQPRGIGGTDANCQLQQVPEAEEFSEDEPSSADTTQQIVRRTLDVIRKDFEPATWKAFWRTAIDGCTAPAAAEELGMTKDAVRQAKARVKRRLREELEGLI